MDCTQIYCDDDNISGIVIAGSEQTEDEEMIEDNEDVLGSLNEQLRAIALVKNICVSRGIDNKAVVVVLRELQRGIRADKTAGLTQTKIDQYFGGQQ